MNLIATTQMETNTKKYCKTTIDHAIRIKLKLSIEQYVFLDFLYNTKNYIIGSPNNVGISTQDFAKLWESLKERGFVNTTTHMISTTDLWNVHFLVSDTIPQVIEHLNKVAGTFYKPDSKAAAKFIKARLKEGFILQDFMMVINNRNDEWGADDHMRQYMRPETLFGTKFESYLQVALSTSNAKAVTPNGMVM